MDEVTAVKYPASHVDTVGQDETNTTKGLGEE